MNELIKELARQAGAHVSARNLMSNPPQHIETVELWDGRIEKFTELIVKECLEILEDEDTYDIYSRPLHLAITRIKKLFGVEL